MGIHSEESPTNNTRRMSENPKDWVIIDITGMTKSTKTEKVLKTLKSGGQGIRCCKVSDQYHNEARNKNCISITILRETMRMRRNNLIIQLPGFWRRTTLV